MTLNSRTLSRKETSGWFFVLPGLVFFTVFLMVPVLGTVVMSLTRWEGISFKTIQFIGLGNYAEMAQDRTLRIALTNNLLFIGFGVSVEVAFALFVAVLLENGLPGTKFFRGVFFMPTVFSIVVVGILFGFIFSPTLGLINPLLRAIGLESLARPWFGEKNSAMFMLIVIYVWQNFGLYMILFVAGLKTISEDLYESAIIDGANAPQRFAFITVPSLRRITRVVVLLAIINSLKLFELVYTLTFGGPAHGTEVLTTWIYYVGFTINKMGYASALAVLLLVLAAGVSAVHFGLSSFREVD